jgi:hypothetical protein
MRLHTAQIKHPAGHRREHDRLAVRVADALDALSDSERVRTLIRLSDETLAMIASAARVVKHPRPRPIVCGLCSSLDHEDSDCPNLFAAAEIRRALIHA